MRGSVRSTVFAALAMLLVLATGCKEEPPEAPWVPPTSPIRPERTAPVKPPESETFQFDPAAHYEVVVTTTMGTFRMELFPSETPKTVERFLWMAEGWRLYDGMEFFRVIPGVLVQTGDIANTGAGSPEGPAPIKGEFTQRKFVAGTVGFARREDMPNSGDTQWFVCLTRRADWDGKFAAFGRVTEGLDVVERISRVEVEGDRAVYWTRRQRPVDPPYIEHVEIVKRPGPSAPAGSPAAAAAAGGASPDRGAAEGDH